MKHVAPGHASRSRKRLTPSKTREVMASIRAGKLTSARKIHLFVRTNFPPVFSTPQRNCRGLVRHYPKPAAPCWKEEPFWHYGLRKILTAILRTSSRVTRIDLHTHKKRWRHRFAGSPRVVPKASMQIQTPYKATCPSYHRRRRLVLNACALSASQARATD